MTVGIDPDPASVLAEVLGGLRDNFNELADPSDPQVWPKVTRESVYQSLRWLEARGLVMRNPGTWYNQEWTATEAGQRAADAAEAHPELRPTRRVAA